MVPASCMCSSCNSRAFLEFSPSKCSDWAAYLAKSWRNGVTNRSSSSNCDFQWSKVLRVLASLASSSSFSSRLKYWGPIRGFQEYLDWIPGFSHFLYWIIQKPRKSIYIEFNWGQKMPWIFTYSVWRAFLLTFSCEASFRYSDNSPSSCWTFWLADSACFWLSWTAVLIILLKNIFKNVKFNKPVMLGRFLTFHHIWPWTFVAASEEILVLLLFCNSYLWNRLQPFSTPIFPFSALQSSSKVALLLSPSTKINVSGQKWTVRVDDSSKTFKLHRTTILGHWK